MCAIVAPVGWGPPCPVDWHHPCRRSSMLSALREQWQKLKRLPPGKRFQTFHREQKKKGVGVKVAYALLSILMFAAGVIFAFIPGPAVVFFALCAALLAAQSAWVARLLDRSEHEGRRLMQAAKDAWRRRRERSHPVRPTHRRSPH